MTKITFGEITVSDPLLVALIKPAFYSSPDVFRVAARLRKKARSMTKAPLSERVFLWAVPALGRQLREDRKTCSRALQFFGRYLRIEKVHTARIHYS